MFDLEPHLIRKIAEEQALFFFGAGYASAYGQKTTSVVCEELGKQILSEGKRHPDEDYASLENGISQASTNLVRLAGLYDHYLGVDAAKQYIASQLRATNVDLGALSVLAELPLSTIITTNFDDLVELAFNHKLDVCFQDSHVGPQLTRRTRLIKMHGSIADYKSMVLNRNDFDDFKRTRPKTYQVIKGQLLEKLPIIVGYSLEDANFREIVKDLRAKDWDTEILVVQLDPSQQAAEEWRPFGVRFIEGDAKKFIEHLSGCVHEYRKSSRGTHASLPTTDPQPLESETDHNPFRFFQTDKIGYSSVELIRRYFIPVPEHAKIVSPASNTLIVGSRGSGKTMLLRFLSIEVQLQKNQDAIKLPFVGFYVKCGAKLFSSMSCRGDGTCANRKWVDFFTHVFNLAITLRLFQILELLSSLELVKFEATSQELFCQQVINNLIRCRWRQNFESPTFRNAEKAIEDEFNSVRASKVGELQYELPLDFLHQLAQHLSELNPLFKGRPLFFLLDEMENLTDAQWQVVNSFLKDRDDPITFKVAAAAEGRPTHDANGKILKYEDDYTVVSTDKYSKDQSEGYISFLRQVADRCLLESACGITSIENLLETREYRDASERLRFQGREFSGFKRFAYLSSGVVRTFVSLLKDTVSYAAPDIARREVSLNPISFQQQNAIVQVKSAIHRQAYLESEHPDDVLALINAIGQVFRIDLNTSIELCKSEIINAGGFEYDHLRPVSQIQIQHFAKLMERTRNALTEALEVGLLQRPLGNRQPQQHSQVPHENFKLHRMLCPYYQLALANRFPRKIEAELLNMVFQLTETEFAAKVKPRGRSAKGKVQSEQTFFDAFGPADEPASIEVEEYDSDAE